MGCEFVLVVDDDEDVRESIADLLALDGHVQALREAFLRRGATQSVADAYVDMFKSFAQKDYRPTERRTAETTTPTTFETFVREVLAPLLDKCSD